MRPVVPLAALSLLAGTPRRAGVPWACSPLTVGRYGQASLHVSLDGTRSIQKFSSLPEQPPDSVRIVFVSDTHNQLSDIAVPPGDIFIHTGDITFCSSGGVNTLKDFNAQLEALPHEHKIVIAGNHDRRIEQLGKNQARDVLSAAHYLENSAVSLCGLKFWGSPFSNSHRGKRSSNSAFQYTHEFQKNLWRYVPNDIDVLLTHGAASGSDLLEGELAQLDELAARSASAGRRCT